MRMLKFHLSLILSLAFFVSAIIPQGVQASTLTEKNISETFDRFHYALAVEWDQQDEAFLKTAQKDFETELVALKKDGLSDEEIQSYMMKHMLSAQAQKEFGKLIKAMKAQNLSEQEATELAVNFVDKKYQEGANFFGKGDGWHHPGGSHKWLIYAVVIIVVIKLCFSSKGKGGDDDEYNEYNYYY